LANLTREHEVVEKRALGRSGIQVSPLAFGGNVLGWTADEARSFELLDAFVAAGFDFIDTADMYSRWVPGHRGGESETVLGNWMRLRGNRNRVVIATKAGMEMGPDAKGLSRAHLMRSVEDSLRRLQTDYIDLYQAHVDDPDTPMEETLEAYDAMIRAGKVRAIGASNFKADRLEAALTLSAARNLPAYISLQPHYNLLERNGYEDTLEAVCLRHGLAVVPYFPLASGFLTGKYRSDADLGKSPRGAWIGKYLDPRGHRVLAALDEVAAAHATTPGAVALAWLLARPSVTAPIASATSVEQLHQILQAASLHLDPAEVARLNEASAT
jgi:aryl-alcohol dehydrogenase-like predicted oxidoreductase